MAKPFNGVINVDVTQSTPDWEPYKQPIAPEGTPSVLYIVLDDVGFSAMEPFGGLIETPNINRIAERGITYTNFHTTALCSPTRSCLMTGRNHTTNGMGTITEAASGFPSSNGHIPFECGTIAEVLGERGWNTYALGKWHLTPEDEMNLASIKRQWPLGRGFERFYGFLGAETNQWYPELVYDNHPVEQPRSPEEGYHLTTDITDKALEFIRDAKAVAPDKPFLLYFCPGACHAPHHAPKEWADRYRGKFDMGYEAYRETVFERQKQMGIMPAQAELSPINPYADEKSADGAKTWSELDLVRPWATLSDDEKRLFSRMAEVYAGFLSHADHEIGRLLDYLEHSGQLDNTMIVLVSDNGASGEGGPNGSVNENKLFNGLPDLIEENLPFLDELGGPRTYNHYPTGWACAFNTPFKLWKRYANWEGGTADPMIVSWPDGISSMGVCRQYAHAVDVVPTIYQALGHRGSGSGQGLHPAPDGGRQLRGHLCRHDARRPASRPSSTRWVAPRASGTRAGRRPTSLRRHLTCGRNYANLRWELFDTDRDPTECHDLAAEHPQKLKELISLWWTLAGQYQALPLENRDVLQILTTERPQIAKPRNRYVYYSGCAEVPESVAPNIRNRSYTIAVEVDIQSNDAEGVLFAQGSRFGGHALYIKEGKLKYVYNWVGVLEQMVESAAPVPTGHVVLSASFEREGDAMPAEGSLTLHIRDEQVGEGRIKTQPGKFSIAGEGLNIGREGAEPVTDDYPGQAPWAFTGGTIQRAMIDVSGQPFVDLATEAKAAFARD